MATVLSPASSSRSSFDHNSSSSTPISANNNAGPASAATIQRRNRSALRDYYNLGAGAAGGGAANSSTSTLGNASLAIPEEEEDDQSDSPLAALDASASSFSDPESYTEQLLATSTLLALVRAQAALAGETRGLDGERKGLVYDNYGRLIGARDVVQQIGAYLGDAEEQDGDVFGGTTTSAGLGINTSAAAAAAAAMASSTNTTADDGPARAEGRRAMAELSQGIAALQPMVQNLTRSSSRVVAAETTDGEAETKHRQQRDRVRWALAAPARVRQLVAHSDKAAATALWQGVERQLDAWGDGVAGVEDLRRRGRAALEGAEQADEE